VKTFLAGTLLCLAAAGCDSAPREAVAGDPPGPVALPALPVSATGPRLETRDTIPAGWYRVRFSQDSAGAGQNLVLFSVGDSLDLAVFAGVIDTAVATPAGVVARGGSESPAPRDTSSVILRLEPGRYVWTSLTRAPNRHRHVANGVWRELRVLPPADTAAGPEPTIVVRLVDHAFAGAETWPSGLQRIGLVNEGKADHLFYLRRMKGDHTLAQLMEGNPGELSEPLGGVTRLGPGQSAQFEIALTPGRYVLSCLITDPATDKLHVELGMLRLVTVTDSIQ
jgi:hypothetical protein